MSLNLYSGLVLSNQQQSKTVWLSGLLFESYSVLKTAIWHWIWDRALPQCPFHRVA